MSRTPRPKCRVIQPRRPDDYDNEREGFSDDPDRITQRELRRYRDTKLRIKEQMSMRQRILDKLKSGAKVEFGRLTVETEIVTRDVLTWEWLRKCVSDKEFDDLRKRIPPMPSTFLWVFQKDRPPFGPPGRIKPAKYPIYAPDQD